MQCERCEKAIPEEEIEYVRYNGHEEPLPLCRECHERAKKDFDQYPPPG